MCQRQQQNTLVVHRDLDYSKFDFDVVVVVVLLIVIVFVFYKSRDK